jgi:hypothetical protein
MCRVVPDIHHPIQVFVVVMEGVMTFFKNNILCDQNANSHSDRKTADVDDREESVSEKVPEGGDEVVSEHENCLSVALQIQCRCDTNEKLIKN